LAEADVVLFDALVSAETLALAPRARKIPVGKRAGRPSASQEVINRLLVQLAQRGERVVRLKGGDPFVFGRGGEEAEALAAAGIPFEVVPGISSALAAPALANIPVTHRGLVSSFVVLSGASVARIAPMLAALPPNEATLVVLMGVAARKEIAESLLARGWDAQTPCALLAGASTPDESQWFGSLSALGEAPAPQEHLPGTLVIGAVVSLAATLAAPHLSQGAPHVLDR
jgi:uroporphyrin-III C-methyltransferase/precorrin-2 dehydrogenase/sirohydrochlorin ferrochelatase